MKKHERVYTYPRTTVRPKEPSEYCTNPVCVKGRSHHTHTYAECSFPGGPMGALPCTNPICVKRGRTLTHVLSNCCEKGGHAWARAQGEPVVNYTGNETYVAHARPAVVRTSRLRGARGAKAAAGGGEAEGEEGEEGEEEGEEAAPRHVHFNERVRVHLPPAAPTPTPQPPLRVAAAAAATSTASALAAAAAAAAAPSTPTALVAATGAADAADAAAGAAGAAADAAAPTSASTPLLPSSSEHLDLLTSSLQFVFEGVAGALTLSSIRRQVTAFTPRLALHLGSDQQLAADLQRLPGIEVVAASGMGMHRETLYRMAV